MRQFIITLCACAMCAVGPLPVAKDKPVSQKRPSTRPHVIYFTWQFLSSAEPVSDSSKGSVYLALVSSTDNPRFEDMQEEISYRGYHLANLQELMAASSLLSDKCDGKVIALGTSKTTDGIISHPFIAAKSTKIELCHFVYNDSWYYLVAKRVDSPDVPTLTYRSKTGT